MKLLVLVSTPHGTSSTGWRLSGMIHYNIGFHTTWYFFYSDLLSQKSYIANVSTPHGTSSTLNEIKYEIEKIGFPHHMVLLLHFFSYFLGDEKYGFPHHMVLLLLKDSLNWIRDYLRFHTTWYFFYYQKSNKRYRNRDVSTPHGTSSTFKDMAKEISKVMFPHHMVLLLLKAKRDNRDIPLQCFHTTWYFFYVRVPETHAFHSICFHTTWYFFYSVLMIGMS